jgi:hypothetical protein
MGLPDRPVVFLNPVFDEVAEIAEGNPLGPVVERVGFGPTRAPKAGAEILDVSDGDIDDERFDTGIGNDLAL